MRLCYSNTMNMRHLSHGFSIVELVIVTIAIAVLASITYFAFGSWRSTVADTEVNNAITNAASALKMYRNMNGTWPTSLSGISYTPGANVSLTYTRRSDTLSYCLKAMSTVVTTLTPYYIDSNISTTPTNTACS